MPEESSDNERRWQDELERDRMAARIMAPGIGFSGPGATDAAAPEEAPEEEAGGEESDEGSSMGLTQKAKLAWKMMPLAQKMTAIAAVVKFLLIVVPIFTVLLILVSCSGDSACRSAIGSAVLRAPGAVISNLLGG